MAKLFTRTISLLLVLCLITDPLSATGLLRSTTFSRQLNTNDATMFLREAFVERALWHLQSLAQKIAAGRRKDILKSQTAEGLDFFGPLAMSAVDPTNG